MNKMKDIVTQIKLYDTGFGFLNFTDGSVVAHPDEKSIGKTLASGNALKAIENGESF